MIVIDPIRLRLLLQVCYEGYLVYEEDKGYRLAWHSAALSVNGDDFTGMLIVSLHLGLS